MFSNNSAYDSITTIDASLNLVDMPMYTAGGALYSVADNTINLNTCDFTGNLGGAVYCEPGCILDFDNCAFEENSEVTAGGAIYIAEGGFANINDCSFAGNSAIGDGGAVICNSDADFTRCSFAGNRAGNNGGAIEAYYEVIDPNIYNILKLNFESCGFVGNKAVDGIYAYGGAVHFQDFDAAFTNCQFLNNTSKSGGGLFLTAGTVTMTGGIINGNKALGSSGIDTSYTPQLSVLGIGLVTGIAVGDASSLFDMVGLFGEAHWIDLSASVSMGGGMVLADTHAMLEDCVLQNNVAESVNGTGGAIILYGGNVDHLIKNCLLTGNSAEAEGGAIASAIHSMPRIQNCTFVNNSSEKYGSAVYSDWTTELVISDSIFENCGNIAIAEENSGGDILEHCLFNNNANGDYGIYDSNTGQIDIKSGTDPNVDPNGTNISGDPLFESGPMGEHYLSQLNSPAVDAGSDLAFNLGLDRHTTSNSDIGDINDVGTVDIGYHYRNHMMLEQFTLTSTVIVGHGTVEPVSETYYDGMLVKLTTTPETGYRVKKWTGTANDTVKDPNNLVVMLGDRDVTVEFDQPRTIFVVSDSDYTSIQRAIDEAVDGDIVFLPTGTYDPPYPGFPYPQLTITIDKGITLSSLNPDNPAIVAATIVDNVIFQISTIDTEATIDGLTITHSRMHINFCSPTIRNCVFIENNWFGMDGLPDGDGFNGVSVNGGAMTIYNGSPLVQNCLFQDCSVTGGDGARGADGDPYGFDGGWAGWAYGGAAYIGYGSNPIFEKCSFVNCFARGGNGGDGGNSPVPGHGGRGGNYTWSESEETGPGTYPDWYWWDGWDYGPYDADGYPTYYGGYYKDFWKYSGHGGAVYIENDSNPQFIDCDFENNHTYGGLSGLGGFPWPTPDVRMEIENFGGAVYACYGSAAEFTRCNFTDNTADPSLDPNYVWPDAPEDVFVSYGGTIAIEDGVFVRLVDCSISGGDASIGGGIYWSDAEMEIIDSDVSGNTAYHGAGMYSVDSTGTISNSTITGNRAFSSIVPIPGPNDPNITVTSSEVFGRGGGYFCLSSIVDITDSVFTGNRASASGGAIYFVGSDQDTYFVPTLHNCLITHNFAGRDGGGISANWFTEPFISNCTIADNEVRGFPAYGGGLYVSYESNVELIDSIIWGNTSSYEGSQVAVCTVEPRPATLTVSYSDIQPDPNDPNIIEPVVLDLVFCIDTTGSMYGAIDAVKFAATQLVNNISNTVPDYRIGIVTYEDYGSDYGFPDDHPYEDVLDFSNDLTTIVNAINSITLGFGGDGPETVYAGLLHAIDPNAMEQRLIDANEAALIELGSPGIGSWRTGRNVRRVIILIGDAQPKDPEPHSGLILNDIVTAATTGPTPVSIFSIVAGFGIFDPFTQYYFNALAEGTGGSRIEAETPDEVVAAIMDVVQLISRVASMIYVEDGCTLNGWDWNPDANSWDPNFTSYYNIAEDPLFVAGYYLSQIDSSQPADSPCVDAGSDDANNPNIGMDKYTTRTDGVNDVNVVDMGYHYDQGLIGYHLTVSVVDANGDVVDPNVGHGYVLPDSAVVYEGFGSNVINLTAYPELGYKVKQWTGTNDDTSTNRYNTVTLTEDKHVTIEFERAPLYNLFLYVIDRGYGPNGILEPNTPPVDSEPNLGIYRYYAGTDVALIATPDPNYEVRSWYGTDDDSSEEPNNVVTMDSNNVFVAVEFGMIGYNIINLYDENMVLDSRSPFPTIQSAVDAAGNNYTVELSKGLYTGPENYNINLRAGLDPNEVRLLTVRSTDPTDPEVVANTIIDCEGLGRAFIFNSGEDPNYIVSGITITNGFANFGGAILCDGASPTIRNCRIVNNSAIGDGGAIYCTNASPRIVNCEISGNSAGGFGGGIYGQAGSAPEIINCLITFNSSGDIGGAMYLYESDAVITLSTIAYNYGLAYDENIYGPIPIGGIACRDSGPTITNCIIGCNGNTYWMYGDILWAAWGDPFYAGDDLYGCSATYSCIEEPDDQDGGGEGNIHDDPLWTTGGLGPFYLSQTRAGQPQTSPSICLLYTSPSPRDRS